jgi:HEXXH motif-containing protein
VPAEYGVTSRNIRAIDPVPPEVVDAFSRAEYVLRRSWPELSREMAGLTRLIVPFTSSVESTFTDAIFIGAVFMSEGRQPFASTMYTAEHLLHEHSHLRFALIREVDPIFEIKRGDQVSSPWRLDARPFENVFNGAFVFARVAEFLRRAEPLGGDVYHNRRLEVMERLQKAVVTLTDSNLVTYTPLGQRLLDEICAQAWN